MMRISEEARQDKLINRMHPLVKLLTTLLAILLMVSVSRYDLAGILRMAVYPAVLFIIGEIPFGRSLKRMRIVLPLVCLIGLFNPFFDREILLTVGGMKISGGVISMLVLMLKGVLAVLSSYLLIATTTIEDICYAMRMLRIPKIFVTELLLIYRYSSVLMTEARRMFQAYQLRAPGQKGIAFRSWGSFAGLLLLRSMDRAETVYESMCIRGFTGDFPEGKRLSLRRGDYCYLAVVVAALLVLRFVL